MIREPNLYTCPRCGWTTDVGTDDAAGDENVVRDRIEHACRPGRRPVPSFDSMVCTSGVGVLTGTPRPFVLVELLDGDTVLARAQHTPEACRALALNLLEAAGAAEHDTALALVIGRLGLPDEATALLLQDVRAARRAL